MLSLTQTFSSQAKVDVTSI